MISTEERASTRYANFDIEGTSFLAFRDVPRLINTYVRGPNTLDYGCGTGRSTRFLKSLKLNVVGVDKSPAFLEKAIEHGEGSDYLLCDGTNLLFPDNYFDFVFSSFVYIMFSTKREMEAVTKEICRVLKKGGISIILTGSECLHLKNKEWVSYETNFAENEQLTSGKSVRLKIKSVDVIFQDYHWFNEDNIEVFKNHGFEVIETRLPIGSKEDGIDWQSEWKYSPFYVYVLRKI